MTTTPDSQNLELSVTDFGPIAKAKIDLRPLTVFVGPSNTGKSYMAVLIYALHQFFNSYSRNAEDRHDDLSRIKRHWVRLPQGFSLPKNAIANFAAWAKEMRLGLETAEGRESLPDELPRSIAVLVHPILNNVAHLSEDLDSEIARCFGVNKAKNLVRYPNGAGTSFSLHGNIPMESGHDDSFEYEVTMTEQGSKIDASIPNTMPLRIDWDVNSSRHFPWLWMFDDRRLGDRGKESFAIGFLEAFASDVVPRILGSLSRSAYYLPADRAGVMHAHQVAVRGLIASASRTVLRSDSQMPVLSGVLGDFLEQLIALADSPHRETEGDNVLAQGLEQVLLRGTVRVERAQIDYPSFVYRPDGWKKDLPLMNASSMVSELAPVVLYLRHVVQTGDLLIIEEPESHLHPAIQVEFIRQLAVAVKSGIRILITTHSEWVLEELANLVRLSELPQEQRKGIDDVGVELRPDEIGAWLFERGSKNSGSVVREMPLDVESGTFPAGFGLITEGLYNRWAEISNRIEEG